MAISGLSQNCDAIKSFNSFRGIKLGERLPDSLKKYFSIFKKENDTSFIISARKIKEFTHLKKYVTFQKEFEDITFKILNDGRVYMIYLAKDADDADIAVLKAGEEMPPFMGAIVHHLILLFGENSTSEHKKTDIGNGYKVNWNCGNIDIQFMIAKSGERVIYFLTITRTDLETIKAVEEYK